MILTSVKASYTIAVMRCSRVRPDLGSADRWPALAYSRHDELIQTAPKGDRIQFSPLWHPFRFHRQRRPLPGAAAVFTGVAPGQAASSSSSRGRSGAGLQVGPQLLLPADAALLRSQVVTFQPHALRPQKTPPRNCRGAPER